MDFLTNPLTTGASKLALETFPVFGPQVFGFSSCHILAREDFTRAKNRETNLGNFGPFWTPHLTTGYLTGVATHLTTGILGALGRSLRQKIQDTPREQALQRCCQAGMAVLLSEDESARKAVQPILKDFFARSDVDVHGELARLVRSQPLDPRDAQRDTRFTNIESTRVSGRGVECSQMKPAVLSMLEPGGNPEVHARCASRGLDQERLVKPFEEAIEGHDLAGFDFARRLADFVEAFLQAADQEDALVDIIEIGQLRAMIVVSANICHFDRREKS